MRYGFARAYAKLNLTLDVLGCRADGYHDLEMIMQSISLCDSVAVRIGCGGDVTAVSNVAHIPNDERNIAVKAARAFIAATGIDCGGVHIAMEKRIPSSAGMAGGSADGAAVLRLLNELNDNPLDDVALCEIGVGVGADIPFCLMGGTSVARAKGEDLTEIFPLCDCFFVVSKPWKGMSTKAVFTEIDSHPILRHPDTQAMISAIEDGDIRSVAENVYNVFEPVVSAEIADISTIKRLLRECGAMCAAMTGSGSSVFGMFATRKQAEHAGRVLKRRYTDTFVAKPVKSSEVRKCIWISQG
ncbi:MAG: 4-(cytidine 5'-diphospho)-2-C-methyl-D-erythritol kinase [Oscillospiraceae bacterium]|nr:4-(cytidine 5'-diphospho)-2-C-methyl-D-erythritol kinase [Oscillospiraceae bacterium]